MRGLAVVVLLALLGCGAQGESGRAEIVISVAYEGASPEQVDRAIAQPLWRVAAGVKGSREVSSEAREGVGILRVRFDDEAAAVNAVAALREGVAAERKTLPEDAEPPLVTMPAPVSPRAVRWVVRSGERSIGELSELAEWTVRPRVLAVPGVLDVTSCGVREAERIVWVDADRLAALALTIDEVKAAIAAENVGLSGGMIEAGRGEWVVRGVGEASGRETLGAIVVTTKGGVPVRVRDLARIEDGFAAPECLAVDAAGPVIVGTARLRAGAAVAGVRDALKELTTSLPPGVTLEILSAGAETRHTMAILARDLDERAQMIGLIAKAVRAADTGRSIVMSPDPSTIDVLHFGDVVTGPMLAAIRDLPGVGPIHDPTQDVTVDLRGSQHEPLLREAHTFSSTIRKDPAVRESGLDQGGGRPEIAVSIDRTRAADLGIDLAQVASTIRVAMDGEVVGSETTGNRRRDVRLRLAPRGDRSERDDPTAALRALHLRGRDGTLVPLTAIVGITNARAPDVIRRKNGVFVVPVWITPQDGKRNAAKDAARRLLKEQGLEGSVL